jgi:hypothetical protein
MRKNFTLSDIVSVTEACSITGVEQVWCKILFTGCENAHEFCAKPDSLSEFSRNLYTALKAGTYGTVAFGTIGYATQPVEQEVVESNVLDKRNRLLLESDFSDLPATQARLNDSLKSQWANYRQELRDLPAQTRFPWDPIWPVKPQ